jgi:hypothetical protein
MDYVALKAEIQSGPLAATLAPMVTLNDTHGIAEALNAPGAAQIGRKLVPSYEILGATDATDWAALSAQNKSLYALVIQALQVDLSNAGTRATLGGIFAAGTASRAAIIALNNRSGSRAEFLNLGTVTAVDVARALRNS